MMGKLSFWLVLVLIGAALTLSMQLRGANSKSSKLSKINAEQMVKIKELNTEKLKLKAAIKTQAELEQDSIKIRDRVTREVVVVEKQIDSSSCGPAVHVALDELRQH